MIFPSFPEILVYHCLSSARNQQCQERCDVRRYKCSMCPRRSSWWWWTPRARPWTTQSWKTITCSGLHCLRREGQDWEFQFYIFYIAGNQSREPIWTEEGRSNARYLVFFISQHPPGYQYWGEDWDIRIWQCEDWQQQCHFFIFGWENVENLLTQTVLMRSPVSWSDRIQRLHEIRFWPDGVWAGAGLVTGGQFVPLTGAVRKLRSVFKVPT